MSAKEWSAMEDGLESENATLRAEVERLTRERDDLAGRLATEEAERIRCREGWAKLEASSKHFAAWSGTEMAALHRQIEELQGGLYIPASHAEKVLVAVAKEAARVGAEDFQRRAAHRLRQTARGHDEVADSVDDRDVKEQEWGRSRGYEEAAEDVALLSLTEESP